AKWSQIQQKETAVSQSHFNDICRLVGHPTPLEYDPAGKTFSFETQTVKPGGHKGFADVYFRGKFIWEYKGPHADLTKAYQQLQLYREDLQNPPLLITSDIHTIIIHTNFNNYPTISHTISFDDILSGDGVEKLSWAFSDPNKFTPDRTQEQITKATAATFLRVANEMKQHRRLTGELYTPEQLAHFLVRLLFCLFAEDMRLLPDEIFTKIVKARGGDYDNLQPVLGDLFAKMRTGGTFGLWNIRYFDGTLFDDAFVPSIPYDLGRTLLQAAEQDWSQVDPSIFGTLFERIIDESKRAQLGAHYTSEADIMLIVEPVLMEPLRRKWDQVRRQADRELRANLTGLTNTVVGQTPAEDLSNLETTNAAYQLLAGFAAEIAAVRVLDPACGSGNFLYVALRQLLDLQKQVITYAARRGLPELPLTVSPEQLYGIEINPYAHELAQITVWIGYLQWRHENGFGEMADPILRPLHNIQRMDAILAYDANGNPVEPEWPAADVIIGNPPFLGGQKLLREFGDEYIEKLRSLYVNRVPSGGDLVTYWFEKAWLSIRAGNTLRAGLIATQAIRAGSNRTVLDNIKRDGDIFFAWSDEPWILDGADVRVSIIGFDDGTIIKKLLDGQIVDSINADLTHILDMTKMQRLEENFNLSFKGVDKSGKFEIDETQAKKLLQTINKDGNRENSDIVKLWINGLDITRRLRNMWIIDFAELPFEEATLYEAPFKYVVENVKPSREKNREQRQRVLWWQFARPRPALREAISPLRRFIATTRVAKHRFFVMLENSCVPDSRLYVIARDDDYFFGVLHSRVHEVWSLATSSRHGVGNDPTYNNTTCFETFPFPWPPGQEPAEADDPHVAEIAHWARELVAWRQAWLHPPREGMYAGLGDAYDKMVKKRTLTNLYNGLVYYRQTRHDKFSKLVMSGESKLFLQAEFDKVTRKSVSRALIEELDDIHRALDTAVLDAYGWRHDLSDEEILEHVLALNLERASV
ncbi:MAG: class I SAM-dependent DNA methyltransferase, partial [Anaerolineales bacterium]|nr:class I SAM-dependent DNA methyltransferase [Anaerolineales bacterium]